MVAPTVPDTQTPRFTGVGSSVLGTDVIQAQLGFASYLTMASDNATLHLWNLVGSVPTLVTTFVLPSAVTVLGQAANSIGGEIILVSGTSLVRVTTSDGHTITTVTGSITVNPAHSLAVMSNTTLNEVIVVDYTDNTISGLNWAMTSVNWTGALPDAGAGSVICGPQAGQFLWLAGDNSAVTLYDSAIHVVATVSVPAMGWGPAKWYALESHCAAIIDGVLGGGQILINILQCFGGTLTWLYPTDSPLTIPVATPSPAGPLPNVSVWDGQIAIVMGGD